MCLTLEHTLITRRSARTGSSSLNPREGNPGRWNLVARKVPDSQRCRDAQLYLWAYCGTPRGAGYLDPVLHRSRIASGSQFLSVGSHCLGRRRTPSARSQWESSNRLLNQVQRAWDRCELRVGCGSQDARVGPCEPGSVVGRLERSGPDAGAVVGCESGRGRPCWCLFCSRLASECRSVRRVFGWYELEWCRPIRGQSDR